MKDKLLRASLSEQHLRIIFVEVNSLIKYSIKRNTPPISCKSHYLKAITSGLLTSPLLNQDERYTLRWHYGQSFEILVDVNHEGGIRSTIDPPSQEEDVHVENLPGKLGVVKSSPHQRLNDGMILADLCDPAQDLATFFNLSDQIPTFCRVFQKDETCHGIFIQGLPGCSPETIQELEQNFNHSDTPFPNLEDELEINTFLSKTLKVNILKDDLKIHNALEPHSFCTCGKEKMRGTLSSLPKSELEDMIKQDGGAQIDCHFCGSSFRFEASDLRALIDSKSQ
jgi:molecular chaperone Hsp33